MFGQSARSPSVHRLKLVLVLDETVTRRLDNKKKRFGSKQGVSYKTDRETKKHGHLFTVQFNQRKHIPSTASDKKSISLIHSLRFSLHCLPMGLLFVSRIRNFFPAKMHARPM
jgi:hypothetical protein